MSNIAIFIAMVQIADVELTEKHCKVTSCRSHCHSFRLAGSDSDSEPGERRPGHGAAAAAVQNRGGLAEGRGRSVTRLGLSRRGRPE
jgi:hypothetical protein